MQDLGISGITSDQCDNMTHVYYYKNYPPQTRFLFFRLISTLLSTRHRPIFRQNVSTAILRYPHEKITKKVTVRGAATFQKYESGFSSDGNSVKF